MNADPPAKGEAEDDALSGVEDVIRKVLND